MDMDMDMDGVVMSCLWALKALVSHCILL